jgi:mono/diheme cytochrome c family protein
MIERRTSVLLIGTVLLLGARNAASRKDADAFGGTVAPQPSPQQLFEDRIMPIFRSPNPSSCTQCHLANIDLKEYILPSHEKTFLSLRDQGMIDLDKPAESKILKLIQRGAQDDNKGAALIHAKVRQAEYDAFVAWIVASAADPKLRNAPPLGAAEANAEKEQFAAEIAAVAQVDRNLALFQRTIWAEQKRCNDCHMPGGKNNAKWVAKDGQKVNWMKREGPAATMKYIIDNKLVDTKNPDKSLLLLKPLAEVEHGGGKKMMKNDACYKNFLTWLTEYAKTASKASAQVPQEPNANPRSTLLSVPRGFLFSE